ncbi:MAG: hypothetical protein H7Y61_19370 [Rhizobiales bacterium]|nr:hypothetical protein [Rhizobacter sp.]
MNASFGIPHLVDLVIAVTLLECAALALYHRMTGRGVAPRDFAVNMLSGLFLMLALRGLASDAGIPWVAGCLLAAGLAHGTDIWLRWRRGSPAASRAPLIDARTHPQGTP